MAEPKNPSLARMRDWPMFGTRPGKHPRKVDDGRARARIADLIMSHVPGTPAEKLAWLKEQKAAGKLDGDDAQEIAEAEALLAMLMRLSGSKERKHKQHLDELLEEDTGRRSPRQRCARLRGGGQRGSGDTVEQGESGSHRQEAGRMKGL